MKKIGRPTPHQPCRFDRIPQDPEMRSEMSGEFYRLAEIIFDNGPDAKQARSELMRLLDLFGRVERPSS